MLTDLRDRLQASLGAAYTLDRELGGGGMSRVFLAHDVALERDVVVKVLAPELAEGVSAERFAREVRVAARLQHPNIVPLHSAGGTGDVSYYTMPYVRGQTLRTYLASGTRDARTSTRILTDIARALAHAHAAGVVHRDVKPENILLADGIAVVADFGIAKALDAARTAAPGESLTALGSALGTPAYMAPEQAAGDEVGPAADVYAWGLIAYELLAGAHPFAGKRSAQALIAAHIVETPTALERIRPEVVPALAALVSRCLAKEAGERPAEGGTLSALLDDIAGASVATPREASLDAHRDARRAAPPPADPGRSIAVLPMANTSGDSENEHFSDGLTDELIGALSAVRGLRVTGRTSSFAFKGKGLDVGTIARELGVTTVLEGSVRRAGNRLKARMQLVNPDGSVVWSESYDRTLTDIFDVQEEIAQAVVGALRVRLGDGQGPLVRPPTADLVAHDLYLKGRAAVRGGHPDDLRRSIDFFEQAIARDAGFAAAWAAMAFSYIFLPIAGDLPAREIAAPARVAAKRALELNDGLAAAHLAMGYVCYSANLDVPGAMRHVHRALELDPGNPEAHQFFAVVLKGQRHFNEAEAHARRALAADPLHPFVHLTLGWVYLESGRAALGVPYLRTAVEIAPHFTLGYEILVHACLDLGRHEEALAQCEHAVEVGGRRERAMLAYVHAVQGHPAKARAILAELEMPEQLSLAPPCHMVYAYTGLGDVDTAIRWIERAFDESDPHLNGLATIPAYRDLHGDPRFGALVARLRHAPPPGSASEVVPPAQVVASPVLRAAPTVGVLPFTNLSSDPENEYLSDGITDEIIGTLGRQRGLRVAGRASCFALKGQGLEPRAVGARLNVTSVVEGSVRRAGNRIRVQAELVNAADGYQLWGERYDRELTDIFAVQEDIAQAIASALTHHLTTPDGGSATSRAVADPDAYRLYLRGRHLLRTQFSPEAYRRAMELLDQAIARDPRLARAYALRAIAYNNLAIFSIRPPREVFPLAREAARAALGIDPELAEAHTILAQIEYGHDWNWQDAERTFARALAAGPDDTPTLIRAALFHAASSRAGRDHDVTAMRLMRHAMELEPLSGWERFVAGTILWLLRRYDEALAPLREAVELAPQHGLSVMTLAGALRDVGAFDEAVPMMEQALDLTRRNPLVLANAAATYAKRGDRVRAEACVDEMVARSASEWIAPYYVAEALGWVGRREEAFRWLERAVEARDFWLVMIAVDPLADPLRGDPRFDAVVRQIGVPCA